MVQDIYIIDDDESSIRSILKNYLKKTQNINS